MIRLSVRAVHRTAGVPAARSAGRGTRRGEHTRDRGKKAQTCGSRLAVIISSTVTSFLCVANIH